MSEERIAELKAENEGLRDRVEELVAEREMAKKATSRVAALGAYLFIGPRLVDTFRKWLEAKSFTNPLPAEETAHLGAAIVRRIIRVGWIGLAVASLPIVLLFWQNMLLQGQIKQQTVDTLIVRRAQLLATIYECEVEEEPSHAMVKGEESTEESEITEDGVLDEEAKPRCVPTASRRARQEAVIAFVEIERGRGVETDLSGVDLSHLFLPRINLEKADLREANLQEADLWEANLQGADLEAANLKWTILRDADLQDANLGRANLQGVNLLWANLARADLRGAFLGNASVGEANLQGANFGGTFLLGAYLGKSNLQGANLEKAYLKEPVLLQREVAPSQWIIENSSQWTMHLQATGLEALRHSVVDLRGADLRGNNLSQSQLNGTHGDHTTILPEGLEYPNHWPKAPTLPAHPEPRTPR